MQLAESFRKLPPILKISGSFPSLIRVGRTGSSRRLHRRHVSGAVLVDIQLIQINVQPVANSASTAKERVGWKNIDRNIDRAYRQKSASIPD